MEELQNTKASLSWSLTKSKEELGSPVTSAAETAKVISSLHQRCDWLLQNFDTRRTAQNGEIVGILKQLKVETSADLTALEKKGLDRKTNHQDLTKAKTEEICVLSRAIQEKETVALKLEQSANEVEKAVEGQEKAEALPRLARPPPWRDKVSKLEWSEVELTHHSDKQSKQLHWKKQLETRCDRGSEYVVACARVLGAQGRNPRRSA